MRKLDFYWATNRSWYYRSKFSGDRFLRPSAPPEARKSYRRYLKQKKRILMKSKWYMD
ncbi:MAG: hypothetical protein IJQ81_03090 [Oscillibacter sp.]|nr:hypothetical protein [Oscillibacter sp.]